MNVILGISLVFLFGLLATWLAEKLKTPAITAYLITGILIGPHVLDLIPGSVIGMSGVISNFTLSLIAFSIGQNFSRPVFQQVGRQVLWISILSALGAWVFVLFSLLVLGIPLYLSLIFAAIATATAPAALIMVVRQYKARGRFTEILMGVVALDDAWGLIIFSVCMAFAQKIFYNQSAGFFAVVLSATREIFLSFLLGGAIGGLFSLLARKVKNSRDLLVYTLGLIMLTAGLALHFHLSVLLACMFLATIIVNLNSQSFQFFDVVQGVDWPIYLLFFVIAGANMELGLLKDLGGIGVVYLITRMTGKFVGTFLGSVLSHAAEDVKRYLALAQMPQAGVALGMALIAKASFEEMGNWIFTVVAATTVIYEIVGPYFVKLALQKAGQIPQQETMEVLREAT